LDQRPGSRPLVQGLYWRRRIAAVERFNSKDETHAMKALARILCCCLLGIAGCALSSDVVVLEQRLESLEAQNYDLRQRLKESLSELSKTRGSTEKNLRSKYAGVNVEMDNLRQELQRVNGRLEEIDYLLNRKLAQYEADGSKHQERLEELSLSVAKSEKQIAALEQYLNIEGKPAAAPAASAAAPSAAAASAAPTDKDLYSEGRQAFDNGKMDKSRQLFLSLIKTFPKSAYADNAQFWIAESYYREKWYERAILEYQTVIEKYPKGNKVPAAKHKQGMAFLQIGDKANARIIFNDLVKKHPKSSEAKIAAQKLKEF
jgi:tol-pal system protein YbgF